MRNIVTAAFLIIPLLLLVCYVSVFHFFGILRKKARTEKEKSCVERLLSPWRNPLLTEEEVEILRGVDPPAFKGFQAARLIGVAVAFLGIAVIVLCALLEMRNA